jgi:predicted metal-dependent hydrolase
MAQARRMRLSVDPRDGAVKLTCPARTSTADAIAFAERHRAWVESVLAALPEAHPIRAGETIPFEGGLLVIDWRAGASRVVRREDDRLIFGGPRESICPRVLRWLRAEALRRLECETRAYGERAGVTIGQVAIGDPRARWGSCSSTGDIRYSWRLVLAPPAVREATVAHEVAHRLHMDHSPAFHGAVERLLGRDPAAERAWLKRHGSALYWVGRES